jgi:hypothetical protein
MLLGGFGFLSRLHGLSIDSLVEAEVVLADGRIVIVNEKEHEGELPVRSLFHMHVLTRKMETSGGDCAAAVRRSASQLATRRERIPSPSSLLGI